MTSLNLITGDDSIKRPKNVPTNKRDVKSPKTYVGLYVDHLNHPGVTK